jgi:hypothetical protein
MSKPDPEKGNLLSVFLGNDTGKYIEIVYDIFRAGIIDLFDRVEMHLLQAQEVRGK